MNAIKWLKLFCIGLLAAGLVLATTGCGDDEEEAGGTTVVTNIVNGTVVVMTNAAPPPNNDDDDDDGPLLQLVAPQLISPEDGARLESAQAIMIDVNVRFEWTANVSAADYILEVDGSEYPVNGTSTTIGFGIGEHTWTVRARTANGDRGAPARPYVFTVAQRALDDLFPGP